MGKGEHYLIVGNWKMHLNVHESSLLLNRLKGKVKADDNVTVVLCPPFVSLAALTKEVDTAQFKLGVQNIHDEDEGAFTGEVSAAMVHGLAEYAIVGHSERRRYFHEDDKFIARKLAAAVRNDIIPILCVGETLHERDAGISVKVVVDQLEADLREVSAEDVSCMAIAYEPVWSIGTGRFAKPDEVQPVTDAIRNTVEELFGEAAGMSMKLLYGGSVEPENAKTFLKIDGINGLLVGHESINYEKFAAIVKAAQK